MVRARRFTSIERHALLSLDRTRLLISVSFRGCGFGLLKRASATHRLTE
jgi:hypothetical protein